MSYLKSTRFFELPYMGRGDVLNEADEALRANIIDGLLYISTYGVSNAIIVDADYSLDQVTENDCSLVISSNNSVKIMNSIYVTFAAVINKRLAYRSDTVTVSDLTQGSKWNIYAVSNDQMIQNPTNVSIIASASPMYGENYLLLATVDFTGSTPVLDYSTGKLFYANVSNHSLTSINPHGTNLIQANLSVSNNLSLGSHKIYPYEILNVNLDGSNNEEISSSSIGINPRFITVMGDPSGIEISIESSNVIISSNEPRSITIKIEGDLI